MKARSNNSKKIVVLAHYCGDLDGRYSNRFVYLASLLSKEANVELVTSNFYHTKKRHKTVTGKYPFKITLIDEVGYKKNIGLKRVFSHWLFARKAFSYLNKQIDTDLIYVSFPSISLAEAAIKFGDKHSVPVVVDVQDLWPESLSQYLKSNLFTKKVYAYLEKRVHNIYTKAAKIVSVSFSFEEQLQKKVGDLNFHVTYIGALWDERPELKSFNKFSNSEIKLVYLGSLGASYDLEVAFKAFAKVKANKKFGKKISFTLIGDGPKKNALEELSDTLDIPVTFLGLIPHNEVQKMLSGFHIAINPIAPWSVASIINKHADYAMAGLPVVNSQSNLEYRKLLEDYDCGINVEPGHVDQMSKAILELANSLDKLKNMSQNALLLGDQLFNRKNTYPKLVKAILELIEK